LAQVFYVSGNRKMAIERYEELYKQGYRDALLGLGEALDDTGQHEAALSCPGALNCSMRDDWFSLKAGPSRAKCPEIAIVRLRVARF